MPDDTTTPPPDPTRDYVVALVKSLKEIRESIEELKQPENDARDLIASFNEKLGSAIVTAKGEKGDKGDTIKGEPGADGVSITAAHVDQDGHLQLSFSDDSEIDVGNVVGRNGADAVFDEDELLAKLASRVPQIDEDALLKRFLSQLPATDRITVEQLLAAVREGKLIDYENIRNAPDVVDLIKRYTAHLEGRGQMGSGASALAMLLDVDLSGIQIGQYVKWDGKKFVPGTPAGAGGGGHTIEDESAPLPARTYLNFIGTGVTATDNVAADSTDVTIPGGYATLTGAETLMNKRNQPRSASSTSNATLTPDLSSANVYFRTTQTVALTINAPTGTPVIAEVITIYVDSAAAQALTFNAVYKPFALAFPTVTTAGKTFMLTAMFNGTDWKTTWSNAV